MTASRSQRIEACKKVEMVPVERIELPTFGLQIRSEVVDTKRIIADYWFADKPLRDMIVDVR